MSREVPPLVMDWKETVFSDSSMTYFSPENPSVGDEVTIRLQMLASAPVEEVELRIAPEGEEKLVPMTKSRKIGLLQQFEVKTIVPSHLFHYRFYIYSGGREYWYCGKGLVSYEPLDLFDFKVVAGFEDPSWVKSSVFYQIFPDRFHNGNPDNPAKKATEDPRGRVINHREWGSSPLEFLSPSHYPSTDYYGGDLEGIRQKIPYLVDLGITALYLNPIFWASTNHKYDTTDYRTIDPMFGSEEEFIQLVKELHQAGIRIILDGVFNHTGVTHRWFNQHNLFSEPGAYNDEHSPFFEYYMFNNHPEDYVAWEGIKNLPKLNYQSSKLRDEIYGPNGVVRHWLRAPYNIDGWRMDVANMLARQGAFQDYLTIWADLRAGMKEERPEAYLMGEHFFDGTNLLQGLHLDGVMNYRGFTMPLIRWLTETELWVELDRRGQVVVKRRTTLFETADFLQQLEVFRSTVPFQTQLLNFNLLDSHDTPRFLSLVGGDVNRFKVAIILLFTYIGVPSVYYGDEVGLEGLGDPDCRRTMMWDEDHWEKSIQDLYKKLITLRKNMAELQVGSIRFLTHTENAIAFARILEDQFSLVVVNRGKEPEDLAVPLWKLGFSTITLQNILGEGTFSCRGGLLTLTLPPYGIFLLRNHILE